MASGILQEEVRRYTADGYLIVYQTENAAHLRRPKKFNIWLAIILAVLSFGVLLLAYLVAYLLQKDDVIFISIDSSGSVYVSGSRPS